MYLDDLRWGRGKNLKMKVLIRVLKVDYEEDVICHLEKKSANDH